MASIAVSEPRLWSWNATLTPDDELNFTAVYRSDSPTGPVYFGSDNVNLYADGNDVAALVADDIALAKTTVSDTALPLHYTFPA